MESLKTLRRKKFMTQKDLAAAVGVSYQTVQTWEAGTAQPRLRVMPKLATALGVEPEQLLTMLTRDADAPEAQDAKKAA